MRECSKAAGILWCLSMAAAGASANEGRPDSDQRVRGRVAVVDMALLFQQNHRFLAAMEQLRSETGELEKAVERERQRIVEAELRLQRRMERADGGLLERHARKVVEQERRALESRVASLEARGRTQRRLLEERETRVYLAAQADIHRIIAELAQQAGILLVLRHDRHPAADDPQSVKQRVNRTIVYQNQLDITDEVLRRLNAGGPAYAPALPRPLKGPVQFLTQLPEVAVKQVATARAAWALNRLVFPPAS